MNANSPRPYVLAETNWKAVQDTEFDVAVLPWGATEAHNYHLPYATDNIQVDHIAHTAAGIAWEAGARVIVLPCVPFGVNTGQMDIPLCLNMNPSTQFAVLSDIAEVLSQCEIDKLVIMNGHGGNHFKQMIRELSIAEPELFACALNWYESINAFDHFDEPGDHAGALETSLVMAIRPELVLPLSEAGSGAARQFKVAGLREGWVAAQREWTQATQDTGVGNPAGSTSDKGHRYLDKCCNKIGQFLIELAEADLHDFYE